MKLCFATNNKGKLQEIKALLADTIELVSLQEIGCYEELPETKDTLEGNSLQKAAYIWEHFGINCFADDSGLEVEVLNGAPGVYSARYAGPACKAEDNMDLLLKNLLGYTNRAASFRTCITLMLEGQTFQFEGKVKGEILYARQGAKGFGYDPIFRPEGFEQSFAEMTLEEKNKISHRAKAVTLLTEFLHKRVDRL
ncbi:MAG TPA: non-canonical purine NTP diphosphatase [Cytophagaceae bacterium]|jgi:XTP/dITP diphosphohydrolase|nr:non-canonical purine NTP diphosphatase [Cytophagaceae bacterium]